MPTSREANRFLLQIFVSLNRLGEALEPLKYELTTSDPKDQLAEVAALPHLFARVADKKLSVSTVEQALSDYLAVPDIGTVAWTVIGRMRSDAGDITGAVDAGPRRQHRQTAAAVAAALG